MADPFDSTKFDPTSPYAGQLADLRKQQIVASMLANMQQPNVGRFYGPLNAISDAMRGYVLGQKLTGIGESEQKLADTYRTGRAAALQDYISKRGAAQPGSQEAIDLVVNAMASPFEGLADVAKKDYEKLFPEDKTLTVDGRVVRVKPAGEVQELADYSEKYGPLAEGPGGSLIQQETRSGKYTGVVGREPKGTSVSVSVAGPKAFDEALGKDVVEGLRASKTAATESQKMLQQVGPALQTLQEGIKSGILAKPGLILGKLANSMGFKVDPTVENTEVYRNQLMPAVGAFVKNFGAGTSITNEDRKRAEQAIAADPSLEEGAMVKLLETAARVAQDRIEMHGQELEQVQGLATDTDFGQRMLQTYGLPDVPSLQQPQSTAAPQPAAKRRVWNPATGQFELQ